MTDADAQPRRECSYATCTDDARWQVGLRLRAHEDGDAVTEVRMALFVCESHAREVQVGDLVVDQNWEMMRAVFTRAFGLEPDRALTSVVLWERGTWLDLAEGRDPRLN